MSSPLKQRSKVLLQAAAARNGVLEPAWPTAEQLSFSIQPSASDCCFLPHQSVGHVGHLLAK